MACTCTLVRALTRSDCFKQVQTLFSAVAQKAVLVTNKQCCSSNVTILSDTAPEEIRSSNIP